ncbi:hypothetical protein B5K03_09835 [Rhizobium phaseoli]|uniref:hypothetical protein n=1 Tax=Rhizobium phaseoli TaxID=396 RepID=UPI00056915FB|nr:hypothetical protein [Rhizobium phaseoli]PWI54466.1 hypothetical protein B5K03_09835 [Rhizobium phaseoli]
MTEDEAAKISSAATWLAAQKEPQPNVFKGLREKFNITAVQAAKACSLANVIRRNALTSEECA